MEKIIQRNNLSFIEQVVHSLSNRVGFSDPKEILWLVYGSYVINMNTAVSDLDIIGIHESFVGQKRYILSYHNAPVHFHAITTGDLRDDGENRLYGGYFTGKIINPHIFLYGSNDTIRDALFNAGKFIGPLAGYLSRLTKNRSFSPSAVTALVYLAYLSTDPSFDSYFLNYFVSKEFDRIWVCLQENIINMLSVSGNIRSTDGKYFFTNSLDNYKDFHFERMKISARHWSYGAVCHGNNWKFPDMIFSKTRGTLRKIDPDGKKYASMLHFLQKQSGLNEVYV